MPTLTIQFYDGERRPFQHGNILLTVRQGTQNLVSRFVDKPVVEVKFDAIQGTVVVVASRSGFRQCGFFVSDFSRPIHLMLIAKQEHIDFEENLHDTFLATRPKYASLLGSDPKGKERMTSLQSSDPKALACMLNVFEAIRWVKNSVAIIEALETIDMRSRTDQDEHKLLRQGMQEDRIFVVANKSLEAALLSPPFEKATAKLHPGAVIGFKEAAGFGEANLNFSLGPAPNQPGKVIAEIDLDYYDDKGAHIALEVIPNSLSKLFGKRMRTSPTQIYALRWMATKNFAGPLFHDGATAPEQRPDFDPRFAISAG